MSRYVEPPLTIPIARMELRRTYHNYETGQTEYRLILISETGDGGEFEAVDMPTYDRTTEVRFKKL